MKKTASPALASAATCPPRSYGDSIERKQIKAFECIRRKLVKLFINAILNGTSLRFCDRCFHTIKFSSETDPN